MPYIFDFCYHLAMQNQNATLFILHFNLFTLSLCPIFIDIKGII